MQVVIFMVLSGDGPPKNPYPTILEEEDGFINRHSNYPRCACMEDERANMLLRILENCKISFKVNL